MCNKHRSLIPELTHFYVLFVCGAVIDGGFLEEWKTAPAPDIAVQYWKMSPNATIRDVVLVIRADEDHHREVSTHSKHARVQSGHFHSAVCCVHRVLWLNGASLCGLCSRSITAWLTSTRRS